MPPRYLAPPMFYTATINLGLNLRGEIRTVQTFESTPGLVVINSLRHGDSTEHQQVITLSEDELATISEFVTAAKRRE